MFTNEIRPYKSNADHRKQTRDAPSVAQVGVLDVEVRRFHGPECRFNLPALFTGRNSIFRSVETEQNLKFQLVRSILRTNPSLTGSNEKITLATRLRFKV